MSAARRLLALDIETTGLDPQACQVVGVGLATSELSEPKVSRDEQMLLSWLEEELNGARPGTVLVTWNGEEFDLPFLIERFRVHGMTTSLVLHPRGEVGKYGKPLYSARWGAVPHLDIAAWYKGVAEERSIAWNLKPVARALLDIEPVTVDNRGEAIAVLDQETLTAYLRSDIEITLALAERVPSASLMTGVGTEES